MVQYSVLIIGAGKIGACFDTPQSESVLTHAHAFTLHPGFLLKGFVDGDRQQAERAADLWGAEVFDSVADAFARCAIDVVVVATPDETHYELLRELADRPLKLVFVEKPLAKLPSEAESVVQLYKQRGIGLAVNYSRRFVHAFSELREKIVQGVLGKYLAGTGYYGKGTLHNGSHMMDLLRFLLGEPGGLATLSAIHDWNRDDPTCSAQLQVAGGQFLLQGVDCRQYAIFEMDLLFEKGRVRIVDSGAAMEFYDVEESEIFSGYQVLSSGERKRTDLTRALYLAAENIYGYLSTGVSLVCTGEDGLRSILICTSIAEGLQ